MESYIALVPAAHHTGVPTRVRLLTRGHEYTYTQAGTCVLHGHAFHVLESVNFLSYDVNRKALQEVLGDDTRIYALIQDKRNAPGLTSYIGEELSAGSVSQ
jgi:hypothetical protein